MKKDENAAAKKKPKTSAAQIRVQKGASSNCVIRWSSFMLGLQILQSSIYLPQWRQRLLIPLISSTSPSLSLPMKVGTMRAVAESIDRCLHVGMYKGGSFRFSFNINSNYPHEPPKVKCIPKVRIATPRKMIHAFRLNHNTSRSTTLMSTLRAMSVLISWEKTGNLFSTSIRSWLVCSISSLSPTQTTP